MRILVTHHQAYRNIWHVFLKQHRRHHMADHGDGPSFSDLRNWAQHNLTEQQAKLMFAPVGTASKLMHTYASDSIYFLLAASDGY